MKGVGLALGGGGARGAYEIGVWKALREMGIIIDVVAGTSVGALNAAMIVQDDFEKAYDIWTHINIEGIIKLQKDMGISGDSGNVQIDNFDMIRAAIGSRGMDTAPLKELLNDIIDEDKIRKSPINLGLVTFSLTDLKPVRLYKEDIPKGKLVDYLLASACFPAFRPHEIDNKLFIDGGIYDNIPMVMVLDKGVKRLIAVDVSAPGIVQRADAKDVEVTYIKNSIDLGGILEFDAERSKTNIEIGYYDCLQSFGKLRGKRYFILPCDNGEKNENNIVGFREEDIKKIFGFMGLQWSRNPLMENRRIVGNMIDTIRRFAGKDYKLEDVFSIAAEITALEMGIDRKRPYTLCQLIEAIRRTYFEITEDKEYLEFARGMEGFVSEEDTEDFYDKIKKLFVKGKFFLSYNSENPAGSEKIKRFRRFVAMAFPKMAIANLFITFIISEGNRIDYCLAEKAHVDN